jgi:hypothetical protein
VTDWIDKIKDFSLLGIFDHFENFLIVLVSRIAPWAAPLAPAYLVAHSMRDHFDAPLWVGIAVGVTLEAVGVASAHITLEMHNYNSDPVRVKTDPKAPFGLGVIATAVYFITGIVLTVVLEVWPQTIKVAPALFFVLAGVAYITLTLISGHARRLKQVATAKEERKHHKDTGNLPENLPPLPYWLPSTPGDLSEFRRWVSDGTIHLPEDVTGAELAEAVPAVKNERTGRNWLKAVRNGNS